MSPASTTVSGVVSAANLRARISQLRPDTVVRSGGRCRSLIAITLAPGSTVTSSRSVTSGGGEAMTIQFLPPKCTFVYPGHRVRSGPVRRSPQTVALFPKGDVWVRRMVRRRVHAYGWVSYHEMDDSNLARVSSLIYHIATRADWERALADGEYTRSSVDKTLTEEGFIHASQSSQVARTANKFYRDVPGDLLLLTIDVERLGPELRLEDVPGADQPFPHIYGPLNL